MDKRTFIKAIGLGMVALPLSTTMKSGRVVARQHPNIYPPLIRRGDTVGIITPSSPLVDDRGYALADENFATLGLRVKWGANVGKRYGYLAGTDAERIADIERMFADPDIKAIVCLRGGSGAARVLDRLDYQLIARNPKIFLGYSDITAFHQAIYTQTGLITFHGAVANSHWTPMVIRQFEQLFFDGKLPMYTADRKPNTITGGTAEGRLFGGNLTVLTGIAGSAYFPDFEDGILFLEEIGEEPYRIDRMFSQLALTGALRKIKGFVFGQCTDCRSKNPANSLTVEQILYDYIRPLGIPAFQGARIGHIDEQFILPIGARVRIDATQGSIHIVEPIFKTT
ncbi:S66 peptidase family protein [Parapedobacter indicus]|uniref:Muramoyltetrapeptide carboxypeptidase n=1 Tax=Parapedobacter indicus TaxID=1477437 RepID=A0A1I3FK79_9SPHI|nr:LD-carboxypeptidase [Parapedobacter indicus]PPL03763.1 muramoyltetrapeptide carboxypeptidase [Parapedobacter indicus]SFI11584.1 muramoyltetrapeptide carboxypeptidase [Parapedobacter indicus]